MKPIIDISFYQNPSAIDYDLLAANVSGVILRFCYGTYKDIYVERHYAELSARGVSLGGYHYIIGNQSMSAQAAAFDIATAGKELKLGGWIDVEDTRDTNISEEIMQGLDPIPAIEKTLVIDANNYPEGTRLYRQNVLEYAALQPDMGIYTSKGAWAAIMGGAYLSDRKLWVAAWDYIIPPLPTGWTSWWLWQHSEKGRLPGYAGNLDMNRFYGDDADFAAWVGITLPVPIEKLFDAKVTTTPPNRLKTRYTPNGNVRPEADWLQSQAIVPVYETHSTGWWRVADAAWSSATWMQRVDDLPLPPPMSGDYAYYGAVYNQRDVRWAAHPLGTKSTIGANGCLMTCASMVCNAFGHMENPLVLNDWLTANDGYLDGNLFLWSAIERLYPDMKFDGFVYNPTTAQIRAAIQAGTLPIMYVDFNDDTPLIEMHWVLGIGVTADDVLIADPWTGAIGKLSEMYGKSVIRYGSYRRAV